MQHEFEFFKEVTKRICGDLAIEKALQQCLSYMQQYMPVYRMYLQRFDPQYNTMHGIAIAGPDSCAAINTLIPVSDEAKQTLRLRVDSGDPDVRIFNNPADNPLCRELMSALSISCRALMVIRLRLKNKVTGSLVCMNDSADYTAEHARMLSLVKEPFFIAVSNFLAMKQVIALQDILQDDNRYLHSELRRLSGDEIIGANFGLKHVMAQVRQVAPLDSPVLLMGETGTGKDVIANALHAMSTRRNGPFIAVNCGAIPASLIDSELFGHEKGAFTGALSQKRGRFERAHTGTIFLDEIGELPADAQVRLLRVLQNREIERVGGSDTISLDIRIIAATNRDLDQMVKEGTFREDLWFRLNVFPVIIPPLRNRTMDIPALVQHFIHQKVKELKLSAIPELAPTAVQNLMDYPWPGNVRELQNVVERALIISPSGPVSFDSLVLPRRSPAPVEAAHSNDICSLAEAEARHITKALRKTQGKVHGPGGAAELLGINASTLRNRMKKLGIDKNDM